MQAYEAWARYVSSIIGAEVENASEKFEALSESEKAAWAAVVAE